LICASTLAAALPPAGDADGAADGALLAGDDDRAGRGVRRLLAAGAGVAVWLDGAADGLPASGCGPAQPAPAAAEHEAPAAERPGVPDAAESPEPGLSRYQPPSTTAAMARLAVSTR
jgi:hypothetical protein